MAYKELAAGQLRQRYRAHRYDDTFYRQEDANVGRLYDFEEGASIEETEYRDSILYDEYYYYDYPFSQQEYSDYISQRDLSMGAQKIVNVASLKGICKVDTFKPLWDKMSAANDNPSAGIEYRLAVFIKIIKNENHNEALYDNFPDCHRDAQSLEVINACYGNDVSLIQNVCLFSPFWVRSPLSWDETSGVELFDHLFVVYADYPEFSKRVWSGRDLNDNLKWMSWFILYAQGGSFKKASKLFDWHPSSQKFWHFLAKETSQQSPLKTVVTAELKRLGMGENDCQLILDNPSYVIDFTDPLYANNKSLMRFWYGVINWLVAHSEAVEDGMKTRVLSWARHQYTETEIFPEGQRFSLQGRSVAKVVEATNAYHNHLAALRDLRRARAPRRGSRRVDDSQLIMPEQRWTAQGWGWGIRYTPNETWVFTELTSESELSDEGYFMEHCVGTYASACAAGRSVIISLQHNDIRCATIEIDPASKKLIQVRGVANQDITSQERRIINTWMEAVV